MSSEAIGNGSGSLAATHGHEADHGHGDDDIHPAPSHFLFKYVFSHDHKIIGLQFLFSGLIFMVLGGLLAMPIRCQALWSSPSLGYQMPPEFYNKLFTMHATIMIFFVIIPLLAGAFGNFLIPLM